MNYITFPEFNLSFKISRIAFSVGNIEIYWYAILISISFIIAIFALKNDSKKYRIEYDIILKLLIIMIPVSIIFARLYYVIFNLEYYMNKPLEIINIRNGGLAIYGGIIGAIIVIILFCKNKKIKVMDLLDLFVPYLALGQSIGRWGNFINGEAHGSITNSIFRMGIVENGIYMEVHPTFLYESICTLTLFFILTYLKNNRRYSGQLTITYLFFYSIIRAVIEGLRTDSLMMGNIRISQLLSILLLIGIIGYKLYFLIKNKRKKFYKNSLKKTISF